MNGEIKEGFLCPICLQDFRDIKQLNDHFEGAHSSTEPNVSHSSKRSVKKAKKTFRKQKSEENMKKLDSKETRVLSRPNEEMKSTKKIVSETSCQPQQLGETTYHTEYFRKIRDSRVENSVAETNTLLIRLHKLITDTHLEPDKRKLLEQSVVHWVLDEAVRLCPSCAHTFNLSRRKHHCRLCGYIICHDCSQFLEHSYARNLIYPSMNGGVSGTSISQGNSDQGRGISTDEPQIRVCQDCKKVLDYRYKQVQLKTNKPIIVQLYEKMREQIIEAERLVPTYRKMADSINAGETKYHLKDAQILQTELKQLSEKINVISRKIAKLGTEDGAVPKPKFVQLQRGVQTSSMHFLRNVMMTIPFLPTQEEVTKLQEERRQKDQIALQQEEKGALQALKLKRAKSHKKKKSVLSVASTSQNENYQDTVAVETGWNVEVPEMDFNNTDDPMLQQINILRNYIKQARSAHRYDEVQTLEANLEEMKLEYMKQIKNN